jgi:signal transduction histidine kinase
VNRSSLTTKTNISKLLAKTNTYGADSLFINTVKATKMVHIHEHLHPQNNYIKINDKAGNSDLIDQ